MTTKRCDHCKQEKDILEFNWKFKALGVRHSTCRECMKWFLPNSWIALSMKNDCLTNLLLTIPGAKALQHLSLNVEMSPHPKVTFLFWNFGDILSLG